MSDRIKNIDLLQRLGQNYASKMTADSKIDGSCTHFENAAIAEISPGTSLFGMMRAESAEMVRCDLSNRALLAEFQDGKLTDVTIERNVPMRGENGEYCTRTSYNSDKKGFVAEKKSCYPSVPYKGPK